MKHPPQADVLGYRVTQKNGKNLLLTFFPTVPVAGGPLMQFPAAQAGWRNSPNMSQREVYTVCMCHPEKRNGERGPGGERTKWGEGKTLRKWLGGPLLGVYYLGMDGINDADGCCIATLQIMKPNVRGGFHLKGARSYFSAASWGRACYHASYESYGCPLSSDTW